MHFPISEIEKLLVKCNYPPHNCENQARWLYKNFKATRPIEICDYHAAKIIEGKTGILLRLCMGDKNQLDESLTGHKYHCPKCDVHLTSLGLCGECGTRYNIGAAEHSVEPTFESGRTLPAIVNQSESESPA